MATTETSGTTHIRIVQRDGICSGKPIVDGTRIKVSDLVIEYDRMGMSADEIVQGHPHLSLAQVHAALSYYYDHIEEIDREIVEDVRFVEEAMKGHVSILERKLGEVKNLRR